MFEYKRLNLRLKISLVEIYLTCLEVKKNIITVHLYEIITDGTVIFNLEQNNVNQSTIPLILPCTPISGILTGKKYDKQYTANLVLIFYIRILNI